MAHKLKIVNPKIVNYSSFASSTYKELREEIKGS